MAILLVMDLLFVLGFLATALYVYFTRNFNFWLKNGIPFLKPSPFFGNLKDVVLQKHGMSMYLTQLYMKNTDKPYLGIFAFDQPALVVFDLDIINNILVKDFQLFPNHILTVDEEKDPLSYKNVINMKGRTWKHMRNNLSPLFTSGKIKKMFYLVEKCAKDLECFLDDHTAAGSPVSVENSMHRFTADVIASCAFGVVWKLSQGSQH